MSREEKALVKAVDKFAEEMKKKLLLKYAQALIRILQRGV